MKYHLIAKNIAILIVSLMISLPLQVFASQNDQHADHGAEELEKRVTQLWEAKIINDRDTIYDMTDKNFRDTTTRDKYIKKSGMHIKEFKISNIEIDNDGKSASSMVIFVVSRFGKMMEVSVKDIWLLEEGMWNLKLSNPRTPFDTMTK